MHFRRRLQPQARVDLIPMIDVVFQLVVFFMLSSTLATTAGISLALPSSETASEMVTSNFTVSIVSEERIYLNGEPFNLPELEAELSESAEDDASISAVVEADAGVPYQLVITVLDVLRRNGLTAANLKTRLE
ncbi:MAG: ExbD/TolR family protein [Alkalispirochaetaceae bacterium]